MIAFRLSIVLAAIVIAWAIVRPAGADVPLSRQNPERCTDLDGFREFIRAAPAHSRIVSMSGIEAQAFVVALNSYPPETNYRADLVFVESIDGVDAVYLVLFDGQCQTTAGSLERSLFIEILTRAQASIS